MHYFQFNIGDYASHTRHLTLMEDLAYRRMLDAYYLREGELPLCAIEVGRIISMRHNIADVEQVLSEFFERTETGWFHKRAEAEIAHFRDKRQKASNAGKASAERRFNGRSTDVQPTNNQEPITINHKPRTKDNIPPKPDGMDDQVWSDFLAVRKSKKAPLTATGLTRMANEAAKAGWTLEEAIAESVARGWQSFKAEWVKDRSHGQERNQHGRGKAKDGVNAALEDLIGFGAPARTADGHGTVSIEGSSQRALAAPSRLR